MKIDRRNLHFTVSITTIFICVLFTFTLLSLNNKVSAEEISYFSSEKLITDTKKTWVVKFSSPLDVSTVNVDNVYIMDNTIAEKISAEVSLSDDKKSVEIKPTTDYIGADSYTVYIKNTVRNEKFINLKKTVALDFRMDPSINTSRVLQKVDCYVNSLFTCIKVKANNKAYSVKIDGIDMQYDGNGVYSINSLDIYNGKNVKIAAYDGNGNMIDTMDYVVK